MGGSNTLIVGPHGNVVDIHKQPLHNTVVVGGPHIGMGHNTMVVGPHGGVGVVHHTPPHNTVVVGPHGTVVDVHKPGHNTVIVGRRHF